MPARLLVKESTQTTERPPEDLSELRDRPCWLDISDPQSKDFELAAKELNLHPWRSRTRSSDTSGRRSTSTTTTTLSSSTRFRRPRPEWCARWRSRSSCCRTRSSPCTRASSPRAPPSRSASARGGCTPRACSSETVVVGGETHDYDTSSRELS